MEVRYYRRRKGIQRYLHRSINFQHIACLEENSPGCLPLGFQGNFLILEVQIDRRGQLRQPLQLWRTSSTQRAWRFLSYSVCCARFVGVWRPLERALGGGDGEELSLARCISIRPLFSEFNLVGEEWDPYATEEVRKCDVVACRGQVTLRK